MLAVTVVGKLDRLRSGLSELGDVVVAFSGGVDSALLAWVANDTLGPERTRCVTAVSASLAASELDDCSQLAAEWGLNWQTVETDEVDRPQYRANDADRCHVCKTALMDALDALLPDGGAGPVSSGPTVTLGVNLDDLGEHRPGQAAARERGARFPLVDAAMSKADVRAASQQLGLRTWDKPAAACLASRVPYGTTVTVDLLGRIERAEAALKRFGFTQLRVRDYGDTARIELEPSDLAVAIGQRSQLVAAVKECGYRYVTLDLEGFRSGNLNAALASESGEPGWAST